VEECVNYCAFSTPILDISFLAKLTDLNQQKFRESLQQFSTNIALCLLPHDLLTFLNSFWWNFQLLRIITFEKKANKMHS